MREMNVIISIYVSLCVCVCVCVCVYSDMGMYRDKAVWRCPSSSEEGGVC